MLPSLFGWLDIFAFWRNLPYPQKGAILRALKAIAASAVGLLLAAATEGSLFPEGTGLFIVIGTTALLQAADKFLREWEAAKELGPEEAEAKAEPGKVINTDATVVEEPPTDDM